MKVVVKSIVLCLALLSFYVASPVGDLLDYIIPEGCSLWLQKTTYQHITVMRGDIVLGYIDTQVEEQQIWSEGMDYVRPVVAHISRLEVQPHARKCGLGTLLFDTALHHLIHHFKVPQVHWVAYPLNCCMSLEELLAFYRKRGGESLVIPNRLALQEMQLSSAKLASLRLTPHAPRVPVERGIKLVRTLSIQCTITLKDTELERPHFVLYFGRNNSAWQISRSYPYSALGIDQLEILKQCIRPIPFDGLF